MKNYAIIENGIVTNIVVADENWDSTGMQAVLATDDTAIGGTYVNGVFSPPAQPKNPSTQDLNRYSTLDYLSKFSDTEYQAVRSGPMVLQRGLDMLIAAQYVDVTDPRVSQYLDAMVTAGIITTARKTELLAPQS